MSRENMNSFNYFPQRLYKLIRLLGASKKDFAAVMGVSASYITQLTTKEEKEPSASFTKLIARTFEISEKWLRGELDENDIFGYAMSQSAYESHLAGLRTKFRKIVEIKIIGPPTDGDKAYETLINTPVNLDYCTSPELEMFEATLAGRPPEEKLKLMALWFRLVCEFDSKK